MGHEAQMEGTLLGIRKLVTATLEASQKCVATVVRVFF